MNVQEDEIGGERVDQIDGRSSVAGLSHDFDLLRIGKTCAESIDRKRLVFNDNRANRHAAPTEASSCGSLRATVKPVSGVLVTVIVAS